MGLLLNNRNVTVTLWRQTGQDAANKAIFAAPVTLNVRYLEKEMIFVDNAGRQIVSNTSITTEDLELIISDWISLGASVAVSPPTDARQIAKVTHLRFVSNNTDRWQGYLS